MAETATSKSAKGEPVVKEEPRTGRCGAYRCQCTSFVEIPGRLAGYVYCSCDHTMLIHERPAA